jgi:hypothetical protein
MAVEIFWILEEQPYYVLSIKRYSGIIVATFGVGEGRGLVSQEPLCTVGKAGGFTGTEFDIRFRTLCTGPSRHQSAGLPAHSAPLSDSLAARKRKHRLH